MMKKLFHVAMLCAIFNAAFSFAGIVNLTKQPTEAECNELWDRVMKNNEGLGRAIVGGVVGIRWLNKEEWVQHCATSQEYRRAP